MVCVRCKMILPKHIVVGILPLLLLAKMLFVLAEYLFQKVNPFS